MDSLDRIEASIERIEWDPRGLISADTLLSEVVPLLRELIGDLRGTRGQRWLTIGEARIEAERVGRRLSLNYFKGEQLRFGGESRLDQWQRRGLADRTSEGYWLLHPVVLKEIMNGESRAAGEATVSARDLAQELTSPKER
jgi:hypothetical protein